MPTPTDAQRAAIEAPLGPVLVVAGPGAGKTFCLIVSGTVSIVSEAGQVLESIGPGDIIDEIGTISPQSKRTITVQAGGPVEALEWDYETVDKGFTALAESLAPQLVDGMLAPFVSVSRVPEEIIVEVIGVDSSRDLILIKQRLQRTSGVKDIKQIQLRSDTGFFTVVLAGSLDSLRRAFTEQDFGSFTTSAGVSGEDRVVITIHSKR